MRNLRTLTVKEVMERTGFGRDAVYRLVHRGALRYVRAGASKGAIRIMEASLEAWFAANEQGAEQKRASARERIVLDADDELDRYLPLDGPKVFS